ncbi:BREX system P-loop protein BrxC [Rhodopirellula sp. SWK7]|uniref:BREX system P-loop protein BrxC n=1 Tax=Rhodopirellula sp. SWK7 TaxID=595460 RepID=UPI0002BDB5F6|nr:BREX system P-loop protein BrxC [Rhodopirellula sp. SWK7]EMI44537.1 hypothetical protein RRSWK_03041 [Rhodopirellula sp. SWK7]
MKIKELFAEDVTRSIPPVVYFHQHLPEHIESEVREYIITGGWNEDHPNYKRVPDGIHEQYVKLLRGITRELDKPGGPDLPNAWISGFYGSGKSSFAKLLGLSLDGKSLPDGTSLSEAWLARNKSQRRQEMVDAWGELRAKINPISVVFDVGAKARDNEHVHAVAIRQLQERLGYATKDPIVADFELKLERDGLYDHFQEIAEAQLGKPWSEVKDTSMVDQSFSLVMHHLDKQKHIDPLSWSMAYAGKAPPGRSAEEATADIGDMLRFRADDATLFFVIDEVSQYSQFNKDRTDKLRAFATSLGSTLRGKVWMLALGQQKLDEGAGDDVLVWARDRFPPQLRVHLSATNIRDVVHRRLLQKKTEHVAMLKSAFDEHRPELKLFAYGCSEVTADEFVEIYPMLPGQIDLVLQITSALRTRSNRAPGDDHAIRGLLQLLGDLFSDLKLAEAEFGKVVSLDQIYEIQKTALDSDTQSSMSRIMNKCVEIKADLALRAAKAVALLELIQESEPTTPEMVAKCLYDRLGVGDQVSEVKGALELLRSHGLLGYSDKLGYKIQSSAGEEWDRERRDGGASVDKVGDYVFAALKELLATIEKPKLNDRPFPVSGLFNNARLHDDAKIFNPNDPTCVTIDFRYLPNEDRGESDWIRQSDESALKNRLVWVCGDNETVREEVRELARSEAMVKKYRPRRENLSVQKRTCLNEEEIKLEDGTRKVKKAVEECFRAGTFYFRGDKYEARSQGEAFSTAANRCATRIIKDLFGMFDGTVVSPAEVEQLLQADLVGVSTKFMRDELGILDLDGARYEATCTGVVPVRIQEKIARDNGVSGSLLLSDFGGAPFGYRPELIKACVAGLIRGSKVKAQLSDGGAEINSWRDVGMQELFTSAQAFRRADFFPADEGDINPGQLNKIRKFFNDEFNLKLGRDIGEIADAVETQFHPLNRKLNDVVGDLKKLSVAVPIPPEFETLQRAIEKCLAKVRHAKPTVQQLLKNLDALREGIRKVNVYRSELQDDLIGKINDAGEVMRYQFKQLEDLGPFDAEVAEAAERIQSHLKTDRPWMDASELDSDVELLREAYKTQRRELLGAQEVGADAARGTVKKRPGFSTLSSDHSAIVLREFDSAVTSTDEDAVSPKLIDLRDSFQARLGRCEVAANRKLDEILSETSDKILRPVALNYTNRVINDETDVDKLLAEIRKELMEQLEAGVKVRIV